MKYTKLPEPHRSLLFKLVERDRAFEAVTLVSKGRALHFPLEENPLPGGRPSFQLLESVGYIIPEKPGDKIFQVALTQEAFDYYKYMHSSALWRFMIDVWDKTEKYWLALFFGWIGGWCAWLSYYLLWRR